MQGRLSKVSSVVGGLAWIDLAFEVVTPISMSIGRLLSRGTEVVKPKSMLGKEVHLRINLLVIVG